MQFHTFFPHDEFGMASIQWRFFSRTCWTVVFWRLAMVALAAFRVTLYFGVLVLDIRVHSDHASVLFQMNLKQTGAAIVVLHDAVRMNYCHRQQDVFDAESCFSAFGSFWFCCAIHKLNEGYDPHVVCPSVSPQVVSWLHRRGCLGPTTGQIHIK